MTLIETLIQSKIAGSLFSPRPRTKSSKLSIPIPSVSIVWKSFICANSESARRAPAPFRSERTNSEGVRKPSLLASASLKTWRSAAVFCRWFIPTNAGRLITELPSFADLTASSTATSIA